MALLLIVLVLVSNEIRVAKAASRVAGALETRGLEQLADVWAEYDGLSRRSYLRIGTIALERSLTKRTSVLADRVIANYRTPLPTVRETQWRMARDSLARAIAVDPERDLRAALRYCEGHLHRINGEARKARGEFADANRELTEAVAAFREAAELRPEWPDPFLGLARTFIYGLKDVDRGADALNQAERNGYTPNEREIAQLADGYLARGNTLARTAQQLSGIPQERDFLSRAAEAYRQALALYSKTITFGDVPKNIRRAQHALNQVEQRLEELSQTTTESSPPADSGASAEPPSPSSALSKEAPL
jgi:tetratricopeptide (TPR) repeat protein